MNIELNEYTDFKTNVAEKGLSHFSYIKNGNYQLIAADGNIYYRHELSVDDVEDYETNFLPTANKKIGAYYQREPFASKELSNGLKLYRRKHGYKATIPANSEVVTKILVPYAACKINKLEIIAPNPLDRIDLKILDSATGMLTGVPNYMLNQFGFDVVVSEMIYSDKSDYDADVFGGMQIEVTYKNDGTEEVTVGYNIIFHEVKA